MAFFKITKGIISQIDEFMDAIDLGAIVFKDGIENYLNNRKAMFGENIKKITELENQADSLRRNIENTLYTHSLLPEFRGDVLKLLEMLDDVIDTAKETLDQFDAEIPKIPISMHDDFKMLAEIAVKAVEALVEASRAFFRDVKTVRDKLHRVFHYEKEADRIAKEMKRRIFHNMPDFSLSEKFHLRYFTLHTESVTDKAEDVADLLSILAIKRTM